MKVNQDATIKDVLIAAQQQEKLVNVILNCGKIYKGTIAQVGTYHLRLELKDQMSFYDAMIRLEHISAVEVQVR
jgi:hypothetical protein